MNDLNQTTPPTGSLDFDLFWQHVSPNGNDEERGLAAHYLSAALEAFEAETDAQVLPATWTLKLDGWPGFAHGYWHYQHGGTCAGGRRYVDLPHPPLVSVSSIKYLDTNGDLQTMSTSDYVVLTGNWPGRVYIPSAPQLVDGTPFPKVTIVYRAGWTVPPADLKQGCFNLASLWFEERAELITGITSRTPINFRDLASRYTDPLKAVA